MRKTIYNDIDESNEYATRAMSIILGLIPFEVIGMDNSIPMNVMGSNGNDVKMYCHSVILNGYILVNNNLIEIERMAAIARACMIHRQAIDDRRNLDYFSDIISLDDITEIELDAFVAAWLVCEGYCEDMTEALTVANPYENNPSKKSIAWRKSLYCFWRDKINGMME